MCSKSKVNKFLVTFNGQISNGEKHFWEERLLITLKAVNTYQVRTQNVKSEEPKNGGGQNNATPTIGYFSRSLDAVKVNQTNSPGYFSGYRWYTIKASNREIAAEEAVECTATSKTDSKGRCIPPPYGIIWHCINTKNEAGIATLKEAIENGDEAQRLANLWNLRSI